MACPRNPWLTDTLREMIAQEIGSMIYHCPRCTSENIVCVADETACTAECRDCGHRERAKTEVCE
jgi:DNA-directed RNA polymerase subunit RPC12/RpoP